MKTINNQLSAILNYAVRFYNLKSNPNRQLGSMGQSSADAMSIWTLDQFEQFIGYKKDPSDHLAFNILFWSGIREGELLALTWKDFIQMKGQYYIDINKNYAVVKRKELILTPKSKASKRRIVIPKFLYDETAAYCNMLYGYKSKDKLFIFKKSHLINAMKRTTKASGLPEIRIHDLRHSHASMLIEMGYNILVIFKRLGHEKVEITWHTYAHLYPDKDAILGSRLSEAKIKGITSNVPLEEAVTTLAHQLETQYSVALNN